MYITQETFSVYRYLINKLCSQAGYETMESLKYQLEMANAKLASLEIDKPAPAPEVPEVAEGGEGEEANVPPPEGGEAEAPPEPATE